VKILLIALVFAVAVPSVVMAFDIPGVDPDSVGTYWAVTDSVAPGKTGDSLYVETANKSDTTSAVFVGEYRWIRVWATGVTDSCRVVAQMSWDGTHWTGKDSTQTTKTGTAAYAVLYDSLYVRGGVVRAPTIPAPYMRWILHDLESGVQANGAYQPTSEVRFGMSMGK
jgi:hypothetical protein